MEAHVQLTPPGVICLYTSASLQRCDACRSVCLVTKTIMKVPGTLGELIGGALCCASACPLCSRCRGTGPAPVKHRQYCVLRPSKESMPFEWNFKTQHRPHMYPGTASCLATAACSDWWNLCCSRCCARTTFRAKKAPCQY